MKYKLESSDGNNWPARQGPTVFFLGSNLYAYYYYVSSKSASGTAKFHAAYAFSTSQHWLSRVVEEVLKFQCRLLGVGACRLDDEDP